MVIPADVSAGRPDSEIAGSCRDAPERRNPAESTHGPFTAVSWYRISFQASPRRT